MNDQDRVDRLVVGIADPIKVFTKAIDIAANSRGGTFADEYADCANPFAEDVDTDHRRALAPRRRTPPDAGSVCPFLGLGTRHAKVDIIVHALKQITALVVFFGLGLPGAGADFASATGAK